MATYTLISSDSHILEPEDLWATRIDHKFRDRAPRLVHEGESDQWSADGVEFTNRDCDPRNAIAAMIYAGTFERHPKLRVGVIEFEIAWAPYFLARLDNVYTERAVGRKLERFKDDMLPSDFFRRNVFISFQEDDLGIQLRSIIGVENLMWGSDYPHAESTFPKSREIVERILKDVPDEEKALIVGRNAARLYHFN